MGFATSEIATSGGIGNLRMRWNRLLTPDSKHLCFWKFWVGWNLGLSEGFQGNESEAGMDWIEGGIRLG